MDQSPEETNLSGESSTGVEFQSEKWESPQVNSSETPKMIQWVIDYSGGLIKDEKQASYVLIGFVVIVIIIILFLFFGGGGSTMPSELYYGGPETQ
jgi:hypothetical protein